MPLPRHLSQTSLRVHHPAGDSETNGDAGKPPESGRRDDRAARELDRLTGTAAPKTVNLPLGKLVPLLMDAVEHQRAWLTDFAEDQVRIDADLYDVLIAYQQLSQKAA